jgi:AraC family transcriptional regulator
MTLRLSAGCFPAEIVGALKTSQFNLTETTYSGRHRLPKHSHERACFVLVVKGSFREEYERRERTCRPLTLIFRPAHEVHQDYFDERGARCLNIELHEQWLRRVSSDTTALNDSAEFFGEPFSYLASRLYREYCLMDTASSMAIEGLLLEIVAQATRRSLLEFAGARESWVNRAEEMIRTQFREPLSLTDIAEAINVHPVHLSTVFRRVYGCTVGEFIRNLRLEFACSALLGSDLPIIRIALAAGFYDQSHFSRTFKRYTGATPASYRSMFRTT